jgi:hypothetical protein
MRGARLQPARSSAPQSKKIPFMGRGETCRGESLWCDMQNALQIIQQHINAEHNQQHAG